MVESPCIKVCQIHTVEGLEYCAGCYRTLEEIKHWQDMEDHIKEYVIRMCYNRRNKLHPIKEKDWELNK